MRVFIAENNFQKGLTIVIPVFNEAENIKSIIKRLTSTLSPLQINYELLFIDDRSSDDTFKIITSNLKPQEGRLIMKKGEQGKAFSLLEGFEEAKFEYIAMIDGDLQYPPEALPEMLFLLENGFDIVIANRKFKNINLIRRIISYTFNSVFVRGLHRLKFDVQSGLKAFRRETLDLPNITPTAWTFDLSYLILAREKGYRIGSVDIDFEDRMKGSSKINVFQASKEIGWDAVRLKFNRNTGSKKH